MAGIKKGMCTVPRRFTSRYRFIYFAFNVAPIKLKCHNSSNKRREIENAVALFFCAFCLQQKLIIASLLFLQIFTIFITIDTIIIKKMYFLALILIDIIN